MVLEVLHPVGLTKESPALLADIIAIHGLNGDRKDTWTHPTTGAFWLKDFLPLDVPGVRIMTFGYNATAAFGNSISDFKDHAIDLLGSLVDKRQKDDEVQRPLVFIAHSLGGIIVKQALTSARIDPKYRSIHEHTVGIIFLGTPHQGSKVAAYGGVLAKLATSVMNKPGPSLVGALERNSAELLQLASSFKFEINNFMVASFYERRPTGKGRLSTVVVDKYSALLEFEGEDQVPADTDHRGICRFADRDDATYDKLFCRLQRMLGTLTSSRPQSLRNPQRASNDFEWAYLHRAAQDGDPTELRRLLREGSNVNAEGQDGMTPLHHAAVAGHDTITFILLNKDATVELQDDFGRTALHCAAENGQVAVVRELIMRNVKTHTKNRSGKTALDCARERQHEAVVWLLENGPEVTAKDRDGNTMLFWAVERGHAAVVKLLAEKGAKVTERSGKLGTTVLHLAADQGNKAIAQLLLEHGAQIDAQDNNKTTALHSAAKNGHLSIVRLLTEEGAETNIEDSLGRTALNLATMSGHDSVVRLLKTSQRQFNLKTQNTTGGRRLDRASTTSGTIIGRSSSSGDMSRPSSGGLSRASTLVATSDTRRGSDKEALLSANKHLLSKYGGVTPTSSKELFEAIKAGKYDVVEELVYDREADLAATDEHGVTALHVASQCGDREIASIFLNENADAKAKDKNGATPLHMASRYGHESVCHLLINSSADIDAADRSGEAALHMASRNGHESMVQLLLESGANSKAKTLENQTALHIASQRGHESIVKMLFEYGVNLDARDRKGMTALVLAVSNGHELVAQFLVTNKADTDADKNGETALHIAANAGHEKVVRCLIESGIDINRRNNNGLTALHIASAQGRESVVRVLLEMRADLELESRLGLTALHLAADQGHEAITRLLVTNKANTETHCGDIGAAPLHYAAMSKNPAVVAVLLDNGAALESQCKNNKATALHYAAMSGSEATVMLLLERGADPTAKSQNGKTASHWAGRPGHEGLKQLLKEKEKVKKREGKKAFWG
ncbi:hypothetical protein FGG08_001544 [Glutinoglossum americanum]|uniref:DUF676 domain-containing protein n=1 Tax=Glutinoglossum americanum TaxID=1670608 RepID=A0A9P8IDB2_9PEZI|nr:hypothetical protein FGG08_001544 [Glutinoglossum americanum]